MTTLLDFLTVLLMLSPLLVLAMLMSLDLGWSNVLAAARNNMVCSYTFGNNPFTGSPVSSPRRSAASARARRVNISGKK